MTIALWVIAVCMVARVYQNGIQLHFIQQSNNEVLERYADMVNQLDELESVVGEDREAREELLAYLTGFMKYADKTDLPK